MKKQLFYALILTAAITSCDNTKTTTKEAPIAKVAQDTPEKKPELPTPAERPDIKKEMMVLQKRLNRFEVASQHLMASAKEKSIVKGAMGCRVLVVPKDMVTPDGQPVTGEIDVELKELPGVEQMVRQGVQTVSDGKLLVSGGSYYVNMTSKGQQLKLKLGKTLKVILPKYTNEQMNVYYGAKDSSGVMNWTETSQKFEKFDTDSSDFLFANVNKISAFEFCFMSGGKNTDSSYMQVVNQLKKIKELAYLFGENLTPKDTAVSRAKKAMKRYESLAGSIYKEVAIQNFGWINCDRFLNETNVTNLACGFEPSDSISYAKVYLVFKSINSAIEERYAYDMGSTFNNVPVGMQGTVIAMAMKKGQLYSSRKEITINKGQKVTLTMKKSKDEDIAALMKF